ncbi:hypothetical protein Tco_1201943, partial [Tanacetum coccineum]
DKPLSFTQDEFISAIGLPICKDVVPLPPKETVRAWLATLGLFDKDKPTLSSTILVNSSPLKMKEVNANDTADKSLSRASMQPVTQSKASTDLKTKKKRIPPSSKPKSSYKVKVILIKKQVAKTQQAEVIEAIADATKNLVASELAEEQGNQPLTAKAEKGQRMAILNLITNSQCLSNKFMHALDKNVEEEVKDIGFVAMEEVTFERIMDEVDSKAHGAQENVESPYDTESKIKIIKSYQAATISGSLFIHQNSSYDQEKDVEEGDASESLFGLRSMPNDDLASISGFKTQDSADHVSKEGIDTLHTFANNSSQSDPVGHLHAE